MERSILTRPVAALVGRITKGGSLVVQVKFADDPSTHIVSRDAGGVWRQHDAAGPSARVRV